MTGKPSTRGRLKRFEVDPIESAQTIRGSDPEITVGGLGERLNRTRQSLSCGPACVLQFRECAVSTWSKRRAAGRRIDQANNDNHKEEQFRPGISNDHYVLDKAHF
jgi:hypothetical protein